MDVTFSSASLAALCNSEERLTRRWGSSIGKTVARRLLDLAAATTTTIETIPEATLVADDAGSASIAFGDRIVVRGVIKSREESNSGGLTDAEQITITSLEVNGSE